MRAPTLLLALLAGLAPAAAQAQIQAPAPAEPKGAGNRVSLDTLAPCASTGQVVVPSAVCDVIAAPGGPVYSINLGLSSSDGVGDKVTLYTGAHAMPGSSTMWARNALLQLDPGSTGGHVDEIDLNMAACDQGNADGAGSACPPSRFTPSIGLLVTGVPLAATAQSGIEVTAAGAGGAVTRALWHQGLTLAGNAVDYADIWENTAAEYVLKSAGPHGFGLDFTNATFRTAALNFNLRAPGQALAWRDGTQPDSAYSIGAAPDGSALDLVAGAGAASRAVRVLRNGDVALPGNVTVAGAVVAAPHTPRSSTDACTPGQVATDAQFIYWCAAPSRWLRAAGRTW